MKFRKVCKNDLASDTAAGPWVKSSGTGNVGCAIVRVKNLRRLPLKEKKAEQTPTEVDVVFPTTIQNADCKNEHKDRKDERTPTEVDVGLTATIDSADCENAHKQSQLEQVPTEVDEVLPATIDDAEYENQRKKSKLEQAPTEDAVVLPPSTFDNADCKDAHKASVPSVETDEVDHEAEVNMPVVTSEPKDVEYTSTERFAPPKAVVKHFFNISMQATDGDGKQSSHQIELASAGILSLEDVLLPSIAHMENQVLRQMQRRVQRDVPDQAHIVRAGRSAVANCLGAAVEAAQKSRLERRIIEEQREHLWSEERHSKREEKKMARAQSIMNRRAEELQRKAAQSLKEKRKSQKNFLHNQELWREVAYLMTESSKLEREARLWKEAETILDAREKDMEVREARQVQEMQEECTTHDSTTWDEDGGHDRVPLEALQKCTGDIHRSSTDIQAALKLVTDLMIDSAKLRKDLYRHYREDHQFEGYRGVNDPKGLIRILSQH